MADFDWLNRRVAIGGEIESLYDARKIAAAGITRVLNLRTSQDEVELVQTVGIEYVSNPTSDDTDGELDHKPDVWFSSSFDTIMATLSRHNSKILIHCQEGLNRAPSTAYFFLRAIGYSKQEAFDCVVATRPKSKKFMKWNDDADAAIKSLGF
jgi:predicted protein tyrosine phosphatase